MFQFLPVSQSRGGTTSVTNTHTHRTDRWKILYLIFNYVILKSTNKKYQHKYYIFFFIHIVLFPSLCAAGICRLV